MELLGACNKRLFQCGATQADLLDEVVSAHRQSESQFTIGYRFQARREKLGLAEIVTRQTK